MSFVHPVVWCTAFVALVACDISIKDVPVGDDDTMAGDDAGTSDSGAGDGDSWTSDAESPGDASSDDSGPIPVVAVFTAGEPCAEKDERGCAAFDSDEQLICRGGHWISAGTCPAGHRCDTRLGSEQGLCSPVVLECADKVATQEFCDGATRMLCGVDRITLGTLACPAQTVCAQAGTFFTTCIPDPTDECALDLDDCTDAPNACVDVPGTFMCQCPAGYYGEGHGPDGCADVLECATDSGGCHPLATCIEVVGGENLCQCSTGYEGTGKGANGCVDVNECDDGAIAACGDGAVSCTNLDPFYSCTCDTDFVPAADGRSCVRRQWSAPVLGGWAGSPRQLLWDGNGVAHAFLSGNGSWISPEVIHFDRTNAWNPLGGTHSPAGQYGGFYAASLSTGGRACITATLGESMNFLLYTPDSGWTDESFSQPSSECAKLFANCAIDAAGNAVAIWTERRGNCNEGPSHLMASRFDVAEGWSEPMQLDPDQGEVLMLPQLVMNATGQAIVLWDQTDGDHPPSYARVYLPNTGWQERVLLDERPTSTSWRFVPAVALSPNGKAVLTWSHSDGASTVTHRARRYNPSDGWADPESIPVRARVGAIGDAGHIVLIGGNSAVEYSPTAGWSTAHAIATLQDSSSADSFQVSIDKNGNAIALWLYNAGTWVAHYRASKGTWEAPFLLSSDYQPLLSRAPDGTAMVVGATVVGPGQLWYSIYE